MGPESRSLGVDVFSWVIRAAFSVGRMTQPCRLETDCGNLSSRMSVDLNHPATRAGEKAGPKVLPVPRGLPLLDVVFHPPRTFRRDC